MSEPRIASQKPQRLILVGMMGSGKSTIGKLLSKATGWPYLDNDELVRSATGKSARELAAAGETELRAAESAALATGLAGAQRTVVGAAAGTVLDAANRAAMKRGGTVIWLRARPDTLAQRSRGAAHRPWLERDPLAWFELTHRERGPLYESVADLVIDVDDSTPEQTAREVLSALSVKRRK